MIRRLMLATLLVLWSGAAFAQQDHEIQFKWNADTPDFEIPAGHKCTQFLNAKLDSSEKAEGTASMKFTAPGGQGGWGCANGGRYYDIDWYSGEWICYHMKMKMDSNFLWEVNQNKMKMSRSIPSSSAGPAAGWTMNLNYHGPDIETVDNIVARVDYDMHPNGPNQTNQWKDYTVGVKLQSADGRADGQLTFWVNDKFIGRSTGAKFCDGCSGFREAWGPWGSVAYPQSPEGTIWFDDMLVTTGPSECQPRAGGALPPPPPPPQPESPPAAPILLDEAYVPPAPAPAPSPSALESPEPFCPGGSNPDPAVIFCDDFEKGNVADRYFEYSDNNGQHVPTPGTGVNDSVGMPVKWETGETGAGDLKRTFGRSPVSSQSHSDQDFREIYWREYVKMEDGWSGAPYKLSRATSLVTSNWAQSMAAFLWNDGNNDLLMIDPVSGTDAAGNLKTTQYNDDANIRWLGGRFGSTPIFSTAESGKWRCVEAHAKLNTPGQSDGVFEFWIDGNLEARNAGMNWVGSYQDYGINAVFFEEYWNGGAPGPRTRYIDNLVISTAPIGCDPTGI